MKILFKDINKKITEVENKKKNRKRNLFTTIKFTKNGKGR